MPEPGGCPALTFQQSVHTLPRMPKLAANLSMMFAEMPFLDRFRAAAESGFRRVEYQFPYAFEAQAVARRAREAGVEVVLHNFKAGDIDHGDRGIACLPDRVGEFRNGVADAVRYAQAVGCRRLNCLAGVRDGTWTREEAFDTLVGNLRYAADVLDRHGMLLMLEAVNTRTVPGFFVDGTDLALLALDAAGAKNAFLQFDLFHMQIMQGDLAATIERLLPRIGHIQIADVPGRNEPGTGEIGFDFLLALLDRVGYEGSVGCEYNPKGSTLDGLAWVRNHLGA